MPRTVSVRLAPALVAALACLSPAPAWGWGEDGHVIVARIAELNLTPKASKALKGLLGPISIAHPRIALFADFVRGNPDYPEYAKSGPWHYVNVPLTADGYDPKVHGKTGEVLARIEEFRKILAAKGKGEDRLQALIFLVHFVGDMHQPLHIASRDDRGGNDLKVRFLGVEQAGRNLHSAWDTDLVRAALGKTKRLKFAEMLHDRMTDAQRKEWRAGDVIAWANEAHRIGVRHVYRVKGDPQGELLPATGTPDLDSDYVARCTPLVELQLQRAGVRLARVLNDALDP